MFDHFSELQTRASMLIPMAMTTRRTAARAAREVTEAELDAVLEASFPASDPPSWTAAVFRPAPEREPLTHSSDAPLQQMLRRVAALL